MINQVSDLPPRFRSKIRVDRVTNDWVWTACEGTNGYGKVWDSAERRSRNAHIVVYELLMGKVPAGLDLDHVRSRGCLIRLCVNPAHLEAVTHRINMLRGNTVAAANAAVTQCPQGHEYTEENTMMKNGTRQCRACSRIRNKVWRLKQRELAAA